MNMQVCRICGTKEHTIHHPACPIGKAIDEGIDGDYDDELFVIDITILNFITNAVAIAGQEFARYKEEQVDEKIGVERWQQYQKDYNEMGDFAQALTNVGFFLHAEDVVFFLKNPQQYQQYYMLWLELERPQTVADEGFALFHKEVWERKQVGKQTENTGD